MQRTLLSTPTISKTALVASFLGLTVAMTGCATANSQTFDPAHKMMQKDGDNKPHWGKKHGMKEQRNPMAELNLTEAQQAQFKALHEQHKAKMAQLQTTLQQYDANIEAQKKAGASTATLLALHQQKQAVMQQFFALHQQQQQQMMAILTPEQQLKFYESRGEHGMKGMKKGMPFMHKDHQGERDGDKQGTMAH